MEKYLLCYSFPSEFKDDHFFELASTMCVEKSAVHWITAPFKSSVYPGETTCTDPHGKMQKTVQDSIVCNRKILKSSHRSFIKKSTGGAILNKLWYVFIMDSITADIKWWSL